MLKIKDSVNLKELEKFGYSNISMYSYAKYFTDFGNMGYISVNKDTREIIRFATYDTRMPVNEMEIDDLIQAGYVEKVGDE